MKSDGAPPTPAGRASAAAKALADKPEGRPSRGQSADVIVIPVHLRMQWTDAMAFDARLTPAVFRVACVIGHHLNRRSGDTHVGQERIAELTGLTARAVRNAIARLEACGWATRLRRARGGEHLSPGLRRRRRRGHRRWTAPGRPGRIAEGGKEEPRFHV
jgi:hypothetical protein